MICYNIVLKSKSVVLITGLQNYGTASKLGYQDGMGALHGSSRFEHIAQQTSLDFIPIDITPT
jgi:hypothetical protein